MEYEIDYVLKRLSDLLGLPIRMYEGNEKVFFYSLVKLPVDPIQLEETSILEKEDDIGYIMDDFSFYYCYLNIENRKMVVGPITSENSTRQFYKLLGLRLSLSIEKIDEFIESMTLLSKTTYQSVLETLSLTYYFLTGKKLSSHRYYVEEARKALDEKKDNKDATTHNSYQIEKDLLSIVQSGDMSKMDSFVESLPYFTSGMLSKNSLGQTKNMFIVSTTLISRAAIKEGMNIDDALSLSDFYIQKADTLQSEKEIAILSYKMVKDYTEKVHEIKEMMPLSYQIKSYVLKNLDEPIRIEELTKELSMPKSTLYRKFKKEMGMSVEDYINVIKIEKSKELILSGSSFASIAYCLGYSSQSHFTNAFKKVVNMTPSEFRKNKKG